MAAATRLRYLAIVGAPGVGKGTYTKLAAPLMGLTHVSSGDLLRAALAAGDPDVVPHAADMAAGRLLPDGLVYPYVRARAAELGGAAILDGFPRRASQVPLMVDGLAGGDVGAVAALHLTLDERFLVEKAVARRTCEGCGRGYNLANIAEGSVNMPPLLPRREGRCDDCDGALVRREDDNEETVRARLREYFDQTHPVLDALRERGVLVQDFELTSGVDDMFPMLMRTIVVRGWMAEELRTSKV